MRRVIVVGSTGLFGGALLEQLHAEGHPVVGAARSTQADLQLDAEDPVSLQRFLRQGDIVLDAAGPFHQRSTTLIQEALKAGCAVVDIADSLTYVERVLRMEAPIAAAGIRVLTACSSVSAVSAAALRLSGVEEPVRLSGFLKPATRHTAHPGTVDSLLRSVGRSVRVFDGGELTQRTGWLTTRALSQASSLEAPRERFVGHLFETSDSILLPRLWPSLRTVDFYVDSNTRGLNTVLSLAARFPPLRALITRSYRPFLPHARTLGSSSGLLLFEIEDGQGEITHIAFSGEDQSHLIAVVPAVLATAALQKNTFSQYGLIPANQYVDPDELIQHLTRHGIHCSRVGPLS